MRKEETKRRLKVFMETYEKLKGYKPTQRECAEYLGVSQPYVNKLIKEIGQW